jgi:sugar phosphate isomerase/epimerase
VSWPLLCSTGALTRHPEHTHHHRIVELAPRLPADGFELMIYPAWYDHMEAITADLASSGLCFPAMHVEKSIGALLIGEEPGQLETALERFQANCQMGQALGAELAVLHLWELPASDYHFERNLAALEQCLPVAAQYGLALAVETIPCSKADPLSNLARALAHDDRCLAALDTEFLSIHNQLDEALGAAWLWAGGRARHLHLRDYDGRPVDDDGWRRYLHPGEGRLNFGHLFAALRDNGFAGNLSLEASGVRRDGSVDVARLDESLGRIRQWMAGL